MKLGTPAVPAAPVAPSLSIKKNAPETPSAPAQTPAEATPAEAPAEKDDAKKKAPLKKKKGAASSEGEPHILFSISSIFALIAVILLTAVVVIQYLNHWEGMQIQVPGLEFLTLGK